MTEYLVSEWGNGVAMAELPQELLAEKGYDEVDSFLDRTLFQSPVPAELKMKMISEFERI